VTVLVKNFEWKKLNGPNDLWIAPNGGIYLTDPFYKRPWWDHETTEQDGEHVYYLAPGTSKLIRVVTDLEKPNGIIGTPDGKYLYIADIKGNKTWRYTIGTDGTLSGKKLFTDLGSDGMTIDNKGNIYLTGKGVTIFNPLGEQIENIPIPESWTANVCFGGKDGHLLFITASKSVYGIKMKVKGVR
jgi:gluconolactonase